LESVTFDGPNKLIIVNFGITSLDVKGDIYSAWKRYVLTQDGSKFAPAFDAVGGDPIGGGRYVGAFFLLANGWKIRPYEGDHTLTLTGNLFGEVGQSLVVSTLSDYQVEVVVERSVDAMGIATGGGTSDGFTSSDRANMAAILQAATSILNLNQADQIHTSSAITFKQRLTETLLLQKSVTGSKFGTGTMTVVG
jgi:hypothetical protein